VVAVLALLLAVTPVASADPPTLEEEIELSIVNGLAWLAEQQNDDGYFWNYCDSIGETGLVILKFEDRALDLGLDPLSEEYEYRDVVQKGLNFIEANAKTMPIGLQPAGDPDGDGDGIGVYWDEVCNPGWEYHHIYNTGIAMMALSASQHPELYGDLVQDAVDFMAFAQEDVGCEPHRGGWRYEPNQCSSDNSTSGYATLGLGYAQAAPPFGFGISPPQFVYDELNLWIGVIQDPVDGDANDGGSHYTPGGGWVNILKTGNLLFEMGLVGDTADATRVRDAVDYIERTWGNPNPDPGWLNHRQAMFTMMKGLESLGIELLDLDGVDPLDEWFPIVAQHLISTQNPDGSWPYDYWYSEILSTAWALLTLEKAVPQFEIPVPVDIKPTSCRNPLNTTEKGVLPVAVLGFEDFDVTTIDPASVRLLATDEFEGVAPLRWAYEDVATPYEPFLGKEGAFACTEEGPDGYMDLTFKFKTQEVIAALGEVFDGDVLTIPLTGFLLEEFGGTPIVGEDVIVILQKKK
jgi:hypothetical protein